MPPPHWGVVILSHLANFPIFQMLSPISKSCSIGASDRYAAAEPRATAPRARPPRSIKRRAAASRRPPAAAAATRPHVGGPPPAAPGGDRRAAARPRAGKAGVDWGWEGRPRCPQWRLAARPAPSAGRRGVDVAAGARDRSQRAPLCCLWGRLPLGGSRL